MAQRFGFGAGRRLLHLDAAVPLQRPMVGWAPGLGGRGSFAWRASSPRRTSCQTSAATVPPALNYVGKPLSYVLATPERPDDADNPLRARSATRRRRGDVDGSRARFGCKISEGFGTTELGVAIARVPDTPEGALGPPPAGWRCSTPRRRAVPG